MTKRRCAAWRTPPVPLVALLAAVLVLGVAWAIVVPPLQAPDEPAHAGYVQSLVEGPGLPGQPERDQYSTEQLAAQDAANTDQTAANLLARPPWSARVWEEWLQRDATTGLLPRGNGGGDNPASSNPPLFYLYDSIPYALASGADFFSRLLAMRLASVLWLLLTVSATWLLAGELLGRDRLLQLIAAATAGLMPMVVFVSAQIGPDGMLYALWSLALWLGVRILKRGATPVTATALLAVTGAALVTKATSYALLPAVLFAIGVALWRLRATRPRLAWKVALGALAALALPFGAWVLVARLGNHSVAAQVSGVSTESAASATSLREFVSYVWQYYLPRLPFMTYQNFSGSGYPAYQVWIRQGWGAFGWLEVRFPTNAYPLFATVTVTIAAAAAARVVAVWRRLDTAVPLFLTLAAGMLLAGLHWTDYHHVKSGAGWFMQGRYAFPLISLAGVAVATALTWLRGTARGIASGVVIGALFALQLGALGLVLTRFHA